MQIKTILNRVQRYPRFVFGPARLIKRWGRLRLEIEVYPRRGSKGECGQCGTRGPTYDTSDAQLFEFVPLWGMPVVFLYCMRRIACPRCEAAHVERVPWAEGKHRLTIPYQWFLAGWAKRLSWGVVADTFHTSWDSVRRSVEMAVAWGRAHQNLEGIRAIGIDEIQWQHGQQSASFLTLVYQVDAGARRLLWVGQKRTKKTLRDFFRWFGKVRTAALEVVCSDMCQAYLAVVGKEAGHTLHVLDRFHIVQQMNGAIDKVRRAEVHELKQQGRPALLTKARWVLLRGRRNRRRRDWSRLRELLQHNLKAVRATLLREDFQRFWTYRSVTWAGKWLDAWCTNVMASQIEPMKVVARSLRQHRELLLNWVRLRGEYSSAAVEGLNNKAKLTFKKAYGFRGYHCAETALYHTLGNLPEPQMTHRFC